MESHRLPGVGRQSSRNPGAQEAVEDDPADEAGGGGDDDDSGGDDAKSGKDDGAKSGA